MNFGKSVVSRIRPHLKWINQARYMKPCVKISQDRFIVTMDVKNFFKDEITVTAKQDYVVIEGRQERKCKNGIVIRQFVRKLRLPDGCTPSRMETRLSDSGVLTFIAHRYASEIPRPGDRKLPIDCDASDPPNLSASVPQYPYNQPPNPCCMPASPWCMPQEPYLPQKPEEQEIKKPEDQEAKIEVRAEKDSCASEPTNQTKCT
ncbi:hypothetical protein O0L34_g2369 [Tuta absoluta]|nr:hypothetical protein O0L34_g2369 [Tuta absoluta]